MASPRPLPDVLQDCSDRAGSLGDVFEQLAERVAHREGLAALVLGRDHIVDERAAMVPGVPRGNVEAITLARANGCMCAEFRLVRKAITAAEELARKQEADHAL